MEDIYKMPPVHKCESKIDAEDYSEMVAYFPVIFWRYMIVGAPFLLFSVLFIGLAMQLTLPAAFCLCVVAEILFAAFIKLGLKSISKKSFLKSRKGKDTKIVYQTEFYDDYFVRKGEGVTRKLSYDAVQKAVETATHFYLESDGVLFIFQKEKCTPDTLAFIRKMFQNKLINRIEKEREITPVFQVKAGILVALTFLSLFGAMITLFLVSKDTPNALFIKHIWVFWLWIPLPVLSLAFGIKYGKKAMMNRVTGAVMAGVLFVFGCLCFLPNMEPEYETIFRYQAITFVPLPDEGELTEQTFDTYFSENITNMTKIDAYIEKEEAKEFERAVKEDDMWISDEDLRKTDLFIRLPITMMNWENVWYLIYNETSGTYNCLPETDGQYRMCVMMYDASERHLEINEYDYAYVQ
nr:YcxB family protein [Lachnospiraceae bacterium]